MTIQRNHLLSALRIGVASAAMQVAGSMSPSNWSEWAKRGHVRDGTSPNLTTDHWNRWREDNRIMADLGLQICRMSIEWARVEPQQGNIDHAALDRYREEIEDLKAKGIKPLVTLHHFGHPLYHFGHPLWFEKLGGFEKQENITNSGSPAT